LRSRLKSGSITSFAGIPSSKPRAGAIRNSFCPLPEGHTLRVTRKAPSLVAIGASAGGVEPLRMIAASLPADLPAAVTVVLHIPAESASQLPQILERAGTLPTSHAVDGEGLTGGHIYVAPPDRHLLVRNSRCVVVRGPRENGVRPAIDPLFRSAATTYGKRLVAVLLSGARSDGVAGALAVDARGGVVVVQDPEEAQFPSMPELTIAHDHPRRIVPVAQIGAVIVELLADLSEEVNVSENGENEMNVETSYAMLDRESIERSGPPGRPSPFGCPACGGVLWEVDGEELLRFRCRVGHAYTAEDAAAAQSQSLDTALWVALRALLERADMCGRIADRGRERGSDATARRFDRLAEEALEHADTVRAGLLERNGANG
jgi:two-component system chemotaxis response regulator CheB